MRGLGPFLHDAWRLATPYFNSEEKWYARLTLAAVVALSLALVGMSVLLSYWNRAFSNTLQTKDFDAFLALLFTWHETSIGVVPGFWMIALVYIAAATYLTFLVQGLQIRWRRWLTGQFLDRWLAERVYYRISLDRTRDAGNDNPDQRIAEDLRDFIGDNITGTRGILSLGLDLLSNVVTLISYVGILWALSDAYVIFGMKIPGFMVWVALVYSLVGTLLTHFVGRPLALLNFRKQRVEADFRFALVRLRENMEGVALYGGEAEEKRGLSEKFHALAGNWRSLMHRYKLLNALTAGFNQVASIFPIVVAAPGFFAGTLTLGDLSLTSDAFGSVQGSLSWVVTSYQQIAVWRATVERLSTFDRAIREARAAERAGHGVRVVPVAAGAGGGYALDDVTLSLPDGRVLLESASMAFEPGVSTIIAGRSGSGKSTLFRALAGIWPFGRGKVMRPEGTSLFLPQRPYFPLGTLRHVVAYPSDSAAFDDETIRTALRDVGLESLGHDLEQVDNWSQRLSGGEQQRLAIARALLQKPDWLFLDEATANLDPESDRHLHEVLRTRLPAATMISVSHRDTTDAREERRVAIAGGRMLASPHSSAAD